ncbi:MAG: 5'/3'-nucleotidase SurE [Chloroflexi bacterium]|jgi:5'-nucleotidase|nr:5'/3'-nucleotidase SurE [Chloroflexota bacterium]
MHILLTNDDGIDAPGLLALAQAMRTMAKVSVLAPDHNWSASGHVKTLHRPLRVWPTSLADGAPAMTTDGAPSDCVALAILGMVEQPIDLVISGINPHANIGHDVTYSGTVTAAMEAAIAGLPGLAVSLDSIEAPSSVEAFRTAADIACLLAKRVLETKLPPSVLLNVNVPLRPREELSGIVLTRQGSRVFRDALVRREDPRGRPYYWIGGEAPAVIAEEGTDSWALAEGFVSVTPLQLDLTAYPALKTLRTLTESL